MDTTVVALPNDDSVDLKVWFIADRYKITETTSDMAPLRWRTTERRQVVEAPFIPNPVLGVHHLQPGQAFGLQDIIRCMRDRPINQQCVLRFLHVCCGFVLYRVRDPCRACREVRRPCLMFTVNGNEHRCLGCQLSGLCRASGSCCDGPVETHRREIAAMVSLYETWGWRQWHDLRYNRPTYVLREIQNQAWALDFAE